MHLIRHFNEYEVRNLIIHDPSRKLTAARRSTYKSQCSWHQVARTVVKYGKLLHCLSLSKTGTKALQSQRTNSLKAHLRTHYISTVGQSFEFHYLH